MNQTLISRYIGEIKQCMAEHAEAAMLRPNRELFAAGEASGIYQGMRKSLDVLEALLSDQLEEERKS